MIEVQRLRHNYEGATVLELDHWTLAAGDHCLVTGPSGAGKTTLLHCLAGLIEPFAGEVRVDGQAWSKLPEGQRDLFRGRRVGIVFQQLHLLPAICVRENLELAQRFARIPVDQRRILELLERLDLGALALRRPAQLSRGQAQRVAIARAVVNRPAVLLADEPTASLDDHAAEQVITLLKAEAAACGAALVIATHDARLKVHVKGNLALPFRGRNAA
jgi:putative ABC transport system ATP-binding protein